MEEGAIRQRVCEVARQLWQRGLMVADEGMITVEVHRRRFLVTPPGQRRAELSPRSLFVTDLGGGAPGQPGAMELENWLPHRVAYQLRDDGATHGDASRAVHATILARPPMLSALIRKLSGSTSIDVGDCGTLPLADAGSEQSIKQALEHGDAVALAGKGVLVVGNSLDAVLNTLERLEHAATIELAVWRE